MPISNKRYIFEDILFNHLHIENCYDNGPTLPLIHEAIKCSQQVFLNYFLFPKNSEAKVSEFLMMLSKIVHNSLLLNIFFKNHTCVVNKAGNVELKLFNFNY